MILVNIENFGLAFLDGGKVVTEKDGSYKKPSEKEAADFEHRMKESLVKQKEIEKAQSDLVNSDEHKMQVEFQAELNAEHEADIEVKRKKFMEKRNNKK